MNKFIDDLNESLIENNCVISLQIEIEKNTLKYNLLLTLSESEVYEEPRLLLYFWDISNLDLLQFGGGLTQFMHLKISTLDSSLDRYRYSLQDIENHNISFNFGSVDKIT